MNRFLGMDEANNLANELFNFWKNGVDKIWFQIAYQAIQKGGLTYYENENDEILVRKRIVLLSILYYEFCHVSALHEYENFNYLTEDQVRSIKENTSEFAENELIKIRNSLIDYFGDEVKFATELWINALEGAEGRILRLKEKTNLYNQIIDKGPIDINMEKSLSWAANGLLDYDHFLSIY